ncbi:MAG: hypothetical protein V4484_19845 [Pseudomonadota bacterium]
MTILFIFIAAAVGFYLFATNRGRKAVRAYAYLAARSDGASQAEANDLANRIDTYRAAQMNDAMGEFVKLAFNGSQLSMISEARIDGFRQ